MKDVKQLPANAEMVRKVTLTPCFSEGKVDTRDVCILVSSLMNTGLKYSSSSVHVVTVMAGRTMSTCNIDWSEEE